MTRLKLRANEKIRIDGRLYMVVRRATGGSLVLEDVEDRNPVIMTDDELAGAVHRGEAELVDRAADDSRPGRVEKPAFDAFPEAEKAEARRRNAYVSGFLASTSAKRTQSGLEPIIANVAEDIDDRSPPKWNTVYKWVRRFEEGGDIRALLPNWRARGNRRPRLPEPIEAAIAEAIAEEYLTPQKKKMQRVVEHAQRKVLGLNDRMPYGARLEPPSREAVRSRIWRLNGKTVAAAREGRRFAEREYKLVEAAPPAEFPLETVEIDHTLLDLNVYDHDHMLLLGRPWVTIALDAYSRCIVGLHVGFEPPSWHSVSLCLRNALAPKENLVRSLTAVKNSWPCHGIPRRILVDNGADFHSRHLIDAAAQLGFDIKYAPVGCPWYKGKIERFFGTLNTQLAHTLPGATFSSPAQRGEYDAEGKAVVEFHELQEVLVKWIVDVYHATRHRSLAARPVDLWNEGVHRSGVRPFRSRSDLDVLLGLVFRRTVQRYGVEVGGITYNSRDLGCLLEERRGPGRVYVDVKVDPSNLGEVRVRDLQTDREFSVPARRPGYAEGLTLYQHRMIKKCANRRLGDGRASEEDLIRARGELRDYIEAIIGAAGGKRRKGGKRLARTLGLGASPMAQAIIEDIRGGRGETERVIELEDDDCDSDASKQAALAHKVPRGRPTAPLAPGDDASPHDVTAEPADGDEPHDDDDEFAAFMKGAKWAVDHLKKGEGVDGHGED